MRSDARQRLLAIAGGGLIVKSSVTGVASLDVPRAFQLVRPPAWKNLQSDQSVTPVTPCHTSESEGFRAAAANSVIGGPQPGVTLGVTAAEGLARLDPAGPPQDVPIGRWVQFIHDCQRFLNDGWANCAERLGWTPLECSAATALNRLPASIAQVCFGCSTVGNFSRSVLTPRPSTPPAVAILPSGGAVSAAACWYGSCCSTKGGPVRHDRSKGKPSPATGNAGLFRLTFR